MTLEVPSPEPCGDHAKEDKLARLVTGLASEQVNERRLSARKLARMGADAEPAIAALVASFCDRDLEVRGWAVKALARLGPLAVPALLEALRQDHPDVQRIAIVTLGEIGPLAREAVPLLIEAREDEWLARAAELALARIQPARSPLNFQQLLPWLVGACLLLTVSGALVGALIWLGPILFGNGGQAAATAGSVLGGVGSVLGVILGHARGSWRGLILGPIVFGLGGAMAGLLLGGLLAGSIAPAVEVLGR